MGQRANAPCFVNEAVHKINQRQRLWFANRILQHFGNSLTGKKIAMWGLAFKPKTDDIRDAPSIDIARSLIKAGASVTAYDAEASSNFKQEVPEIEIATEMYSAVEGADALVICTEWSEFSAPDFNKLKMHLASPVIFDGRNIYTQETMARHHFHYYSVGRPTMTPATVKA